jgi:PAS domain S-box-containing protein
MVSREHGDRSAGSPEWRQLVEADPSAVLVLDSDGRVAAWNAAAERLFGLVPAAAISRAFSDLEISYRVPKLRATIEDIRHGLTRARLADVTIVRSDGQPLTVRVTAFRAGGGPEAPPSVIVRMEDRSEESDARTRLALTEKELDATRVELQTAAEELQTSNEELRESNEELSRRLYELEAAQQADRHKNEFLAMLAHELRNPLAPILSAMQVIRQQAGDDSITQRAREIVERQVRHQARLLDDLLDVSRITRGKVELRREPLSLGPVVADALEITRSLIQGRRHVVTTSVADEPVVVEGDPTRLTQVVANLLNNAAKFTPPGGTISVTAARENGDAVLSVRDSGVGIPREMLPRVFELFTQIDAHLVKPVSPDDLAKILAA